MTTDRERQDDTARRPRCPWACWEFEMEARHMQCEVKSNDL